MEFYNTLTIHHRSLAIQKATLQIKNNEENYYASLQRGHKALACPQVLSPTESVELYRKMRKDIMPGSRKRQFGDMIPSSVPNTLTMAKYKKGSRPEIQKNLSGYFGISEIGQFGSPQNDREEP